MRVYIKCDDCGVVSECELNGCKIDEICCFDCEGVVSYRGVANVCINS